MKTIFFLLFPAFLAANQINPELQTKSAIVYLNGAQLTSQADFSIPQGRTKVLFSDLSPDIDPNSIQINGLSDVALASVNFGISYLEKGAESKEIKSLENLRVTKDRELTLIKNKIAGLQKEEAFLTTNMKINTNEQSVPLIKMIEYSSYYRKRIAEIRTEIYDASQQEADLQKEINDLQQEIDKYRSGNTEQRGEIELLLDSPRQVRLSLTLSYNVSNAGWFPTYDIKTKSAAEPLSFFYKANVYQETGNDWENVLLVLSTGNPALNTKRPEVQPYYLGFVNPHTYRPRNPIKKNLNFRYNPTIKRVTGKVVDDKSGLPLAGVNIIEAGTSNGTQTDFDGNYNIDITRGKSLEYNYVGYIPLSIPIYSGRMDVTMQVSASELEEVVVSSFGIRREGYVEEETKRIPTTVKSENMTATLFEITGKYSIPSSSETMIVAIDEFDIPAKYEYYTAPLLTPRVYLTAKITDWENHDILPGEANIYFDGGFAGTTYLQPIQTNEEMLISLGEDTSIAVERERINNLKDKSFFGNTRIIGRHYKISLKNNKTTPVEITLLDRIPISQNNEIEVKGMEYGNAKHNKETGVLTWQVNLSGQEATQRELKYEVRYPKDKSINLMN